MKHELQQRTIGILSRCMDMTLRRSGPTGRHRRRWSPCPDAGCYISAARLAAESRELFSRRARFDHHDRAVRGLDGDQGIFDVGYRD